MFNKETEYALRALVYIQSQNLVSRNPGIYEISKEIESPHFYTAKILQRIVKQGLLESQKGKGGGFYFDKQKPDLKLIDLLLVTEGDRTFSGCGFGLKACDDENQCPLHFQYSPIRASIHKLVTEESIQSIVEKKQEIPFMRILDCPPSLLLRPILILMEK